MAEFQRRLSLLGFVLVLMGGLLLLERYLQFSWHWGMALFGFAVLMLGLKPGGDKGYLFPGIILTVTSVALMLNYYHWLDFQIWRIWPLTFASIGLGLVVLYAVRYTRMWILIPGGFLLFVGGAGLGFGSWWRYQRWLRSVVDLWPLLLIVSGIILTVGYWRHRNRQKNQVDLLEEHL